MILIFLYMVIVKDLWFLYFLGKRVFRIIEIKVLVNKINII